MNPTELRLEFEIFWKAFPRRVAKFRAQQAYTKAREAASAEEILAGVERYKVNKPPTYEWCHPSTFLNQGRWMDEPDAVPVAVEITREERERAVEWRRAIGGACPHHPPCSSASACIGAIVQDWRRAERGE